MYRFLSLNLVQNGPIRISSNYSLFENQYAWSTVADYVWIDQPVYVAVRLRSGGPNGHVSVGLDSVLPTRMVTVSTVDIPWL